MSAPKEPAGPTLATRVEIAFEDFPCGPCAGEAEAALGSIEGVARVEFNACVRRATVHFDPAGTNIAAILAALSPFTSEARVLSVVIPNRRSNPAAGTPPTSFGDHDPLTVKQCRDAGRRRSDI